MKLKTRLRSAFYALKRELKAKRKAKKKVYLSQRELEAIRHKKRYPANSFHPVLRKPVEEMTKQELACAKHWGLIQ